MGRRLNNWLSKASSESTRSQWRRRWQKFAVWATTKENPLTGKAHMECAVAEVDDVIRTDFEDMPSHLFHDKYRDVLTKYLAGLNDLPSNTALAYISSVRSFFTNEAVSIKLQKGKLPTPEMAMGEHQFNINEFRSMWLVANIEGKARLSTAVSLGWGVSEFLSLKTAFIRNVIFNVDNDGFASFDYRRGKTKARIRGILTSNAVKDLDNYLKRIPSDQIYLWTTRTKTGMNYWLKRLCKEAGIQENGTIRFHLIRKYTFDIVSSQCGEYEAKLLVGKKIPLSDATYLHGLEERLLDKYKKDAFQFLRLNGTLEKGLKVAEENQQKINHLQISLRTLSGQMNELAEENENIRQNMFHQETFGPDEVGLIKTLQKEVQSLNEKDLRKEKKIQSLEEEVRQLKKRNQ